jgi:hydrogenase nickel incorporation protein HypB
MNEIEVGMSPLEKNRLTANQNKSLLDEKHVLMMNIMAAPGAGKTSVIAGIAEYLKPKYKLFVIEADLATSIDTDKLNALGIESTQINTISMCHLEAHHISERLGSPLAKDVDIILIENVGNLVCPSEYYLGEDIRMVIISAAEGHDKVAKYPNIFFKADAIVLNKIDLMKHVDFDESYLLISISKINPKAEFFRTSCQTGEGLSTLAAYIAERLAAKRV